MELPAFPVTGTNLPRLSSVREVLMLRQWRRFYLRPVVVVPQGGINHHVGEVFPDGPGHVTDHLDHHVCGELAYRDVRRTVTGGEGQQEAASSALIIHLHHQPSLFVFIVSIHY